ncbi:hypothetical protein D3C81_1831730 [compost metagenome]
MFSASAALLTAGLSKASRTLALAASRTYLLSSSRALRAEAWISPESWSKASARPAVLVLVATVEYAWLANDRLSSPPATAFWLLVRATVANGVPLRSTSR